MIPLFNIFTIEGLVIPLNIRHHALHVHWAVETEMENWIRNFSRRVSPTWPCLPHSKLDSSWRCWFSVSHRCYQLKKPFYHFYYFCVVSDNGGWTNERPVSRSRDHSLTNQSRVWDNGGAGCYTIMENKNILV